MTTLKVTQIGDSLGVILPREVASRLRLSKGDEVSLVETADGIELTPFDPEFEERMAAVRRVAKRYRNTLRELAK
jgi:putative addiction module antidote